MKKKKMMMTQSWVSCGGFDSGVTHSDRPAALFFILCQTVLLIRVFSRRSKPPPAFSPPQREVVTSLLNNVCRGPPCRGPFLTDTATGDTSQQRSNTQLTYKTLWNSSDLKDTRKVLCSEFGAAQTTTNDSCIQSSVVLYLNDFITSNYHVDI